MPGLVFFSLPPFFFLLFPTTLIKSIPNGCSGARLLQAGCNLVGCEEFMRWPVARASGVREGGREGGRGERRNGRTHGGSFAWQTGTCSASSLPPLEKDGVWAAANKPLPRKYEAQRTHRLAELCGDVIGLASEPNGFLAFKMTFVRWDYIQRLFCKGVILIYGLFTRFMTWA